MTRRPVVPLLCPATTLELVRVLSYPQFQLAALEQKAMLAEILPFCETAAASEVGTPVQQLFLRMNSSLPEPAPETE